MKLNNETDKLPVCAQLSVRAIIIENRKVLMVEHEHDGARGRFWVLPGGGVEKGETISDAVVREITEETGIEVKPVGVVHVRETETQGQRGFEIYMICTKISGEIDLGKDPDIPGSPVLKDCQWFTSTDLGEIFYYPESLRDFLPSWVDGRDAPMVPLPIFKEVAR